jgi:hypothetical protein
VITKRAELPIPDDIQDALNVLRSDMRRPDGEELIDNMAVAKCAKELACGFHYRWIYPKKEPRPLIDRWFAARKDWNSELRDFLADRKEHLDSEKLATDAAKRYHGDLPDEGPSWGASAWPAWRDVQDLVQPATDAVRLNPYLAQDAADWGLQNRGIIWYAHCELGEWISELSGLPLHGGGPDARAKILAETGERSIVASIKSHGRGRNGLQFRFSNQLIASPPSSATAWEQLFGRLHRAGQTAATIYAAYNAHTEEFQKAYAQSIRRATYVEGHWGQEQKLLK